MGPKYRAFQTGGNPNDKNFKVQGLGLNADEEKRLDERHRLLESLDTLAQDAAKQEAVQLAAALRQQAFRALAGESRKVFDMSAEKDALRDRYGRNPFGQSCLLARRLVEYGVPFITVVGDNFGKPDFAEATAGTLTGTTTKHMKLLCPPLDQGFSALLDDLSKKGLLETTIVMWHGEFGRSPDPESDGGRGHWPYCFTGVVAGGGFKGGMVVGESDAEARYIKRAADLSLGHVGERVHAAGNQSGRPLANAWTAAWPTSARPPPARCRGAGFLTEIM